MREKIKIVIIGNGFGGIYTLKNLHKYFCGNKNIEITLVGERNYFLFTPLLHEVATGSINQENIVESIRKILGCCLSKFYLGKAKKINTENKTVEVGQHILPYDYLVLAVGAETNFYSIKGAQENSLTLKSLQDAMKIKNQVIEKIECASHITDKTERKKMLTFTIVGGGPTGVELAVELQELIKENFTHYYKEELISEASVVLIQKDKNLLPQFGEKIQRKSLEILIKKGVQIMLNTEVMEVSPQKVLLKNGKEIATETVIWVAGIKPKEIDFEKEVQKTNNTRLVVNEYLQLENYNNIFALGDATAVRIKNTENFLPALAQVAEKEAKIVAQNLFLLTKNKKIKPFHYKHSGDLISLGQWMAIGEISNFTFSGHLAWWLWRTVYLSKLISFRKKIRVAMDWTINLFYPRDISEIH